jgi:Na+-driven multidrug efflux pump
MWQILRVGLPSSVNTIISSGNAILMTGLVGPFGSSALAGFGLGTRLEYILMPIIFGFGTAVITIVGAGIGAGNIERAKEATRNGGMIAAAFTGAVGLVMTLFPDLWLRLFTQDASVVAVGEAYLHRVGPVYVCFGAGMICYAASQGLGRAAIPLWVSLIRLVIVAPLGIWAGRTWGVNGVFAVMAGGYAFFGITLSAIMAWLFRTMGR